MLRSTTDCTILPGWGVPAGGTERREAASAGRWWNTEDHLDTIAIDLDPPDQGSDDRPSAEPIEVGETDADLGGEVLQLADDQGQLSLGFRRFGGGASSLSELGDAHLEPGDARLGLEFLV